MTACVTLLALAAEAQKPVGDIPEVADARNRIIGEILQAGEFGGGPAFVHFRHRPTESNYGVWFTRDYIFSEAGDLLWDQPDCQGQPVIIWNHYDAANALYKPTAIGPRRSLWIPVKNPVPLDTWPMSRYRPPAITCEDGDPARCTIVRPEGCENVDWVEPDEPHTPVIAMIRVAVLDDHFVLPYKTR